MASTSLTPRPRVLSSRGLPLPLLLLSLLSLPTLAAAESSSLTLDPARTEISFDLPATGHDVHGVLEMTAGQLSFDPETGKASGEITIDSRKASTENDKRDKKMHLRVLESARFPRIVFRPDHIEGRILLDGESDFELVGTLTLLGQDHEFSMASHATIHDGQLEATASFPVPYVDWGLHNPSVLVLRVGKVVQIQLSTAGSITPLGSPLGESTETGAGH